MLIRTHVALLGFRVYNGNMEYKINKYWARRVIGDSPTYSYFVSTVGASPLSVIKQYIEKQKQV